MLLAFALKFAALKLCVTDHERRPPTLTIEKKPKTELLFRTSVSRYI